MNHGVSMNCRALTTISPAPLAGRRSAPPMSIVQRSDTTGFTLARDIDPTYAAAFDRARDAGVEMLSYDCRVSPEEIAVNRRITVLG